MRAELLPSTVMAAAAGRAVAATSAATRNRTLFMIASFNHIPTTRNLPRIDPFHHRFASAAKRLLDLTHVAKEMTSAPLVHDLESRARAAGRPRQGRQDMSTRTFAMLFGVVFLAVGVLGFVPGLVQ